MRSHLNYVSKINEFVPPIGRRVEREHTIAVKRFQYVMAILY